MEVELFGFKIHSPKFDFIIESFNGQEFLFPNKYMKYFIILSTLLGIKFICSKLKSIILKILLNIRIKFTLNKQIKENNRWVVIFGLGDNINSITLAKYFGNRGFNLLFLLDKNIHTVRKEYDLSKIQELNKLPVKIIEYEYEEFLKSSGKLDGLIDYIFDTSVLRVYNNDLGENDIKNHLDNIFYIDCISAWFNKWSKIMEKLRLNFHIRDCDHPMRIFIFNYPDKCEEINHKMFYDLRKSLYMNYQDVFKHSLFFATIKFNNEFKGYYLNEKQLKSLEIVNSNNKESCLYGKSLGENNFEINYL